MNLLDLTRSELEQLCAEHAQWNQSAENASSLGCKTLFQKDGASASDLEVTYQADVRYAGQAFQITIALYRHEFQICTDLDHHTNTRNLNLLIYPFC